VASRSVCTPRRTSFGSRSLPLSIFSLKKEREKRARGRDERPVTFLRVFYVALQRSLKILLSYVKYKAYLCVNDKACRWFTVIYCYLQIIYLERQAGRMSWVVTVSVTFSAKLSIVSISHSVGKRCRIFTKTGTISFQCSVKHNCLDCLLAV